MSRSRMIAVVTLSERVRAVTHRSMSMPSACSCFCAPQPPWAMFGGGLAQRRLLPASSTFLSTGTVFFTKLQPVTPCAASLAVCGALDGTLHSAHAERPAVRFDWWQGGGQGCLVTTV